MLSSIFTYLLAAVVIWCVAVLFYRAANKGLSDSAIHQQMSRFGIGSVIAVVPTAVACGATLPLASLLFAGIVAVLWATVYPILYHISNRKVSPDYDNYMDEACGMYFYALLSALLIASTGMPAWLGITLKVLAAMVEFALLFIVLSQLIYYAMYRNCIDHNGMQILQETNANEVIEFYRSYSPWVSIGIVVSVLALVAACFGINLQASEGQTGVIVAVVELILVLALAVFIFKGKRSGFARSGIVALWLTIRDYTLTNRRYAQELSRRVAALDVKQKGMPWTKPTTIVMVIGESASRDYMSAITPMERDTTPWMSAMAKDEKHPMLIFPNAYASHMHTVAVLEKALTEFNQYNGKTFYESCSVVDIVRKAGYRIHWYSNQGHLGSFDTPVTLVADTADVAKWTKQELNKVQYDMSLLDFLDEIDPTVNNFIVLHLKGSHFNYLNRYPAEATVWGQPGVQENVDNYMNSIRYTDTFLKTVYERCRRDFNMQAMVYFSDHGTIPTRRRTPGFDGYGHVHIPLAIWLGDEYIKAHPDRVEALKENQKCWFTNDLAYELMCGLFDIESPNFDESASLASRRYRFDRDMLTTFDGKIRIADDPDLKST